MLTSSRYQIVYPAPTRGDSADVPRDIGALVTAVERSASYGQGTLATRPTSTAGTPGIQGRFYMATDQTPMVLYYDYGTGWASVGSISAGSIGTAQLADDSVTGGPAGAGVKLKQLTVTHDNIVAGTIRGGAGQEVAAGSVAAVSLAAALFPSQGAGGATEALRAIGAGAGNVVAGNDARLTDQRVPIDNTVTSAKVVDGSLQKADFAFLPVETPNVAGLQVKVGSTIATTDGNGQVTITFPSAFPTALLSFVGINGDVSGGGEWWFVVVSWGAASVFGRCCNGGGNHPIGVSVRVNWVALGT